MASSSNMNYPHIDQLEYILELAKKMPHNLRSEFNNHAGEMIEKMTRSAEHIMHFINADSNEDEVKAVVNVFPSTLSDLGDSGQLPIHSAAWWWEDMDSSAYNTGIPMISFLAEEGDRLNVGGEGTRGGLLVPIPATINPNPGDNVLQVLTYTCKSNDPSFDKVCLDAMKRLRKCNLLRKEDIWQFDLLPGACNPSCRQRFEYLVDWYSEALREYNNDGNLFFHKVIDISYAQEIEHFAMMLKAGLKYYPEELGLLFQKNSDGKTACEFASEKHGEYATCRAIEKCIDDTSDNRIAERNPVTNVYPFMHAAAGDSGDLNVLYYLLRRNPEVIIGVGEVQEVQEALDCSKRKKRRRSSSFQCVRYSHITARLDGACANRTTEVRWL